MRAFSQIHTKHCLYTLEVILLIFRSFHMSSTRDIRLIVLLLTTVKY